MEDGGIMENKDDNKQQNGFNPAIREDGRLNYPESGMRPCGFFEAVGEATGLKKQIGGGGAKKIKPRDLSVFCHQFESINGAGVSVNF